MKFLKLCVFNILSTLLITANAASDVDQNPREAEQWSEKNSVEEPVNINNFFPVPEADLDLQNCMDECIHQNQKIAMGYEAIEEICIKECKLEEALRLYRSGNEEDRIAAIKTLCANSRDTRTLQPLINALDRDIEERTGLWAWIIPALGASDNQKAVPVLTQTLTNMNEDWLGREMSARALGDIRDPASVPYLINAAWRADTRDAAIEALAKYQDERVIPVLLSALNQEEDEKTLEAALNGLQNLGAVAVPEMLNSFSDYSKEYPRTKHRLWLCHLLGTSGDARAFNRLHKSINDPDKAVSDCAREYLRPDEAGL